MGTVGSRICELENGSNIYLGGLQATTEPYLVGADVTHVVNCAISLPHMKSVEKRVVEMEKTGGLSVLRLNWKDERAQQLIGLDFALRSIYYAAQKGRSVLIHCEQGKSRSGSVMIAYLMAAHNMSFQQALQFVRERRSIVRPNSGFHQQLVNFEMSKELEQLRFEFRQGPKLLLTTPPAPQQSPSMSKENNKLDLLVPHTPVTLFKVGTKHHSNSEKSFFSTTTEASTTTPSSTPSSSPMNTPSLSPLGNELSDDESGVAEEKEPNNTIAAEGKGSVRAQLKELQKKLVNYELSEDGFLAEARKLVSNETTNSTVDEFKEVSVNYNRPVRSISTSGYHEEEKTMGGTNGMQENIKERLKALQYLLVTKQLHVSEFQNALRGLPLQEI